MSGCATSTNLALLQWRGAGNATSGKRNWMSRRQPAEAMGNRKRGQSGAELGPSASAPPGSRVAGWRCLRHFCTLAHIGSTSLYSLMW